jgi:hypothetical protein
LIIPGLSRPRSQPRQSLWCRLAIALRRLWLSRALITIVVVRSLLSERPLRTGASALGAITGGLGLSAPFWLPPLLENDLIKGALLRPDSYSLEHLPTSLMQLLRALGPVHLAFAFAGLAIAVRATNRQRRIEAKTFAGLVAIAALLAAGWSEAVLHHGALRYFSIGPSPRAAFGSVRCLCLCFRFSRSSESAPVRLSA